MAFQGEVLVWRWPPGWAWGGAGPGSLLGLPSPAGQTLNHHAARTTPPPPRADRGRGAGAFPPLLVPCVRSGMELESWTPVNTGSEEEGAPREAQGSKNERGLRVHFPQPGGLPASVGRRWGPAGEGLTHVLQAWQGRLSLGTATHWHPHGPFSRLLEQGGISVAACPSADMVLRLSCAGHKGS